MRRFLTRSGLALAAVVAVLGVTESPAGAAAYFKFEGVDGDTKASLELNLRGLPIPGEIGATAVRADLTLTGLPR